VAIAFFSLFTALGASAFVIRVRSLASHGCPAAAQRLRMEAAREVMPAQLPGRAGFARGAYVPEPEYQQTGVATQGMYAQRLNTGGPVAVELLSREEAVARAERQLDQGDRENVVRFRAAERRGDAEVALLIYNDFGVTSPARYVLERERTQVADEWLAVQLARLDRELGARDCGAVNERIERISRLVPDRHLPSRMACE
jgi:hypothetical protein